MRVIAVLFSVMSCSEGTEPGDLPDVPSTLEIEVVVSDPVAPAAATSQAGAAVLHAGAITYVSLQPGAVPAGRTVTITNRRTVEGATAPMVEGGLDPVAIGADAGDTLEFAIDTGGTALITFRRLVPQAIAVAVVRTEPPAGRRDVPLNLRVRVVFSEPVLPASVAGNLALESDGTPVAGETTVSADGLDVTFQPAADLLPGTTYTLRVGEGILDSDGTALAAPVDAAFTTLAAPPPPAFVPQGFLAVVANHGIYTMLADGSEFRQVTAGSWPNFYDAAPAWSPDGSVIAFTRFSGQEAAIYVVKPDGSELRQVSPAGVYDVGPTWSPEGDRIAFTRYSGLDAAIFVVKSDGSELRQVSPPGVYDGGATWSPDGSRLATVTALPLPDQPAHVFSMRADGTERVQLTRNNMDNGAPAWSPDGSRIAFVGDPPGDATEGIFLMNADGSDPVRLTADTIGAYAPAWSPDGRSIAFGGGNPRSGHGLFAIDPDGTGLVRLAAGMLPSIVSWSPDGSMVLLSNIPACDEPPCSEPQNLWVVRVADRLLYQLPYQGIDRSDPSWAPGDPGLGDWDY